MIFRIEIENFYSICDPQIVDLRVTAKVPDEPHRFTAIYPGATERVPKVVGLFGGNAAGKTSVLRALAFIAWFVRDSFQLQPEAALPFEHFLNEEAIGRPTRLALSLGGVTNLAQPEDQEAGFGSYHYELEIAHQRGRPSAVARESLVHRPHGARKPYRVFERGADGRVTGSKSFPLSGLGTVADKIRWNASAISTLAQFEHTPALTLRNAALNVHTNLLVFKQDASDAQIVEAFANVPGLLDAVNLEIPRVDLGTREMEVLPGPHGRFLQFHHDGLGAPVPWFLESHGTQSFIRSFPLVWAALQSGGVAIIDELDASLHPHMLPEIARWFYDPDRNPRNAQLWLTCQNASFLEDLAKEEIFFCEKDNFGRTRVYGLQDIKDVRRIDNYYRKYLTGAYGAVPNIG